MTRAGLAGRRLPVVGRPSPASAEPDSPSLPSVRPSAKPAEPDDPLTLVGVAVPVDEATFDEMADVVIEDFVRDGWPEDRLLAFFRSPFYAGLHVVWRRRGEAWVRERITAARARWHRAPDGTRRPVEPTRAEAPDRPAARPHLGCPTEG